MARGRPPKAQKATVVVVTETVAPFVPPPVAVPDQVYVPRTAYHCTHCGGPAVRDGDTPGLTARFRCTRCGTCPRGDDGTGCGRPGAKLVGGAFHCGHCATRDGRKRAFPRAGNATRFKLAVKKP